MECGIKSMSEPPPQKLEFHLLFIYDAVQYSSNISLLCTYIITNRRISLIQNYVIRLYRNFRIILNVCLGTIITQIICISNNLLNLFLHICQKWNLGEIKCYDVTFICELKYYKYQQTWYSELHIIETLIVSVQLNLCTKNLVGGIILFIDTFYKKNQHYLKVILRMTSNTQHQYIKLFRWSYSSDIYFVMFQL